MSVAGTRSASSASTPTRSSGQRYIPNTPTYNRPYTPPNFSPVSNHRHGKSPSKYGADGLTHGRHSPGGNDPDTRVSSRSSVRRSSIQSNRSIERKSASRYVNLSDDLAEYMAKALPSPSAHSESSDSHRTSMESSMSSLDIPPRKPSQTDEVAAVQSQAVQRSWLPFRTPWINLLIAISLMPMAYYLSSLNSLSISTQRYEMIGQPGHHWNKSRFGSSSSPHGPAQLNFTGYIEPFFAEYTDFLVNQDYQTLFADARDADDAITAMVNGLFLSELEEKGDKTGVGASATAVNITTELRRIRSFADLRAGIRKRAEVNFENFLRARIDVAHRVLNASIAFHTFLNSWDTDGKQTPGANCKFEAWVHAELAPPRSRIQPWWVKESAPNPLVDTWEQLRGATKTPDDCAGSDANHGQDEEQHADEQVLASHPDVVDHKKAPLLNSAVRAMLDAFIRAHRDLYIMREKPAGLPDMYGRMWPDSPDWKQWPERVIDEEGAPGQRSQEPKNAGDKSTKDEKQRDERFLNITDRPLWCVADVRLAEAAERRLLPYLMGPTGRSASPFKELWTPKHARALGLLRKSLEALQQRLVTIESQLIWLRERLGAEMALDQEYQRSEEKARGRRAGLVWVEDLVKLQSGCSKTIVDLFEAMAVPQQELARIRWHYLKERKPEAVVSTWRAENCGDTSCFNAADGAWGKFLAPALQGLGLAQGKPLARRPEGGFKEGHGIAAYEKACCGESYANPWLDLLKYDHGQQLWFLSPYRELGDKLIGFDEKIWLEDGKL